MVDICMSVWKRRRKVCMGGGRARVEGREREREREREWENSVSVILKNS